MKLSLTSFSSYTGSTTPPTCIVAYDSCICHDTSLSYASTDSLSLQTPILLLLLSLKRDDSTIYLTGLTSYISFIFYTHDTLLTVFCSSHTSPDSYMHYLHKLLSLFHEATYLSAPNRAHSLQYILYYVSSHYYYPFLHVLSFQNSSCFLFFVLCISGSRSLSLFFVLLEAGSIVASTVVHSLIRSHSSSNILLITLNILCWSLFSSRKCLKRSIVLSSGIWSLLISISRNFWNVILSYISSSVAGSERLYRNWR